MSTTGVHFCVITKINSTGGCVAVPPGLFIQTGPPSEENDYRPELTSVEPLVLLNLRTWVFTLGEILVVDSDGREIGGAGRKPMKWDVEIMYFGPHELPGAIAKSMEVTNADS